MTLSNEMPLERLQDLSIVYWLKELFTGSFVNVVDGFPEGDIVLPTVAVDADTIDSYRLELGNRKTEQIRVWTVDIFAIDKSQRDAIGYLIFNELDENIPVYNYNQGFPPNTSDHIGSLETLEKKLKIIKVIPELTEQFYYRCSLSFSTVYNVITEV